MNDSVVRIFSFAGLARLFPTLQVATVLGLLAEGRLTDSLTYRLFAGDPFALVLAGVMALALMFSWFEWTTFILKLCDDLDLHWRGRPAIVMGICLMVLSGASLAAPPYSPTLAVNYLLTGIFSVVLGWRLATPAVRVRSALHGY
ncbi:hypothetical protein [uncultured Paraglaciecola sp.]|uniref:hypothetical protein n=1 Tax=uncultured Paraglaciecola sp. TaxID=1765024 RepID=UPI002637BC39|nr:hypothetical protein [uncultured Paraglaciecola sp.]